jgi:F-type H+-transporting ATPase subunit delta
VRSASAGRYARAFVRVAGSRGRVEESVSALERASEFFASDEGRAAGGLLQSSRVPASERGGLLVEIATALSLNDETMALVDAFVRHRALGSLGAVAARARLLAAEATGIARVELRTARALSEEIKGRIARAAEKLLARPVKLNVVEDEGLMAGVVMRAGDRIWDGTLAGALARAGEALGRRT